MVGAIGTGLLSAAQNQITQGTQQQRQPTVLEQGAGESGVFSVEENETGLSAPSSPFADTESLIAVSLVPEQRDITKTVRFESDTEVNALDPKERNVSESRADTVSERKEDDEKKRGSLIDIEL